MECKTTITPKKSFSIKREWVEKMKEEAFACNKQYAALSFNFEPNGDAYYIIDEKTFLLMFNSMVGGENDDLE